MARAIRSRGQIGVNKRRSRQECCRLWHRHGSITVPGVGVEDPAAVTIAARDERVVRDECSSERERPRVEDAAAAVVGEDTSVVAGVSHD